MGRNKFGPYRGPWEDHEWDAMHIAVAPVELERGERLWTSHEELLERFHIESVPSGSGVTHLLFWRR